MLRISLSDRHNHVDSWDILQLLTENRSILATAVLSQLTVHLETSSVVTATDGLSGLRTDGQTVEFFMDIVKYSLTMLVI